MTPGVQWQLQQEGYDPERAAEALPSLIRVARMVAQAGTHVADSDWQDIRKYADSALAMARTF